MVKVKKKFIVIGVVIALIIAAIVTVVLTLTLDDSIESLYIGNIEEYTDENSKDVGILLRPVASSSGYAAIEGNGKVRISYEDEEVYSDEVRFKEDTSAKEIRFDEFVLGNGDYDIEISYGDKSDSKKYSIDWVSEYIYIDAMLGKIDKDEIGVIENGELTLPITALNGDTTLLFEMASSVKSDLQNNQITEKILEEFSTNGKSLVITKEETKDIRIMEVNGDEWLIKSKLDVYLVREADSQLEVYDINKGLMDIPKNVEVDISIVFDGSEVHSDTIILNSAAVSYKEYDYYATGAGMYEFSIDVKNTMVKETSPLYTSVTSTLKRTLNQKPVAGLGAGFSFSGGAAGTNHYEKSVPLTSSEASAGYEIEFDASSSANDGSLTYEWDWEYANDLETDITLVSFDVDETGMIVSHTFHPDISLLSRTDDVYIGLRVVGDQEIEIEDGTDGSTHKEIESHIVTIHIEFTLTI